MAATDLISPYADAPATDPVEAEYQARQRRLNAEQTAAQHAQQQLQQSAQATQQAALTTQEAQRQAHAQTLKADATQWSATPGYENKSFVDQPPETKAHYFNAYSDIADQVPGAFNAAQRAVTGNQNIGVTQPPAGAVVSESVGPDGAVHRNFQVDTTAQAPPGADTAADPFAALPKGESDLARAIAAYQLPFTALSRMPPIQRARILGTVTQSDPNFDANQYQTRQSVMKSFAAGPDAANVASANTLIGHIDEMLKAGKELKNGSFTPWNSVANAVSGATGNPAPTRFMSTSTAVADELAKLFKGTGAASDSSIKDWKATLSPKMSPEQIQASAEEAMKLMASRLDALKEKYQTGMGKPLDRPLISNKSAAVLRRNNLAIPDAPEQPTTETAPAAPTISPEDQAAINWANANKADPRAIKILSIHGIK